MTQQNESFSPYLFDFIKKKVDLSHFLETEIGCRLRWYESNISAGTTCPMPGHSEKKPSFRILKTDSGVWIYHCLGCGTKGTIIDFFREYYGLNSAAEAVLSICRKFGFNKDSGVASDSLNDVKKKIDLQKKINCANIVSSRQCHALLRKDFKRHSKWVADAYHKMNEALEKEDIDTIEAVGFEASSKMGE